MLLQLSGPELVHHITGLNCQGNAPDSDNHWSSMLPHVGPSPCVVASLVGKMSAVSADSEGNRRTAKTKKCPCAGEKLEAATGVEPVMEVLQTSGGRTQG